jgi:dephospho-CoA kinase
MQQKHIIALVGEPLAGKDTVAKYLAVRYKAAEVRYSHVLDDILEILALEVGRSNEVQLALTLRGGFGTNILSRAVLRRALESTSSIVVLNGIRVAEEVEEARGIGAHIMYVTAPVELRYQRYLMRAEKSDDGKLSLEEFIAKADNNPNDKNIPELGRHADMLLENTGDMSALYAKIDSYIDSLS